jgi:hypothetical protein
MALTWGFVLFLWDDITVLMTGARFVRKRSRLKIGKKERKKERKRKREPKRVLEDVNVASNWV